MRTPRKNWAPAVAPIFLRIALGVTFLWAGLGKIEARFPVSGDAAALLANMGVEQLRDLARPLTQPIGQQPPPAQPKPEDKAIPTSPPPNPQPATQPNPQPATQPTTPPTGPQSRSDFGPGRALLLAQVTAPPAHTPGSGKPPVRKFVAADFPNEIAIERVYGLALVIHRAANPAPKPSGADSAALWPKRLARGGWPIAVAWTVAISEIVAGLFVLIGLLTRLSAGVLICLMLGAMWLTEIGPAMQSGNAFAWFLPDRPRYGLEEWKTLLWQFSLLSLALSLAFAGSGTLAFDRRLFPPAPPAPPPPKPMT